MLPSSSLESILLVVSASASASPPLGSPPKGRLRRILCHHMETSLCYPSRSLTRLLDNKAHVTFQTLFYLAQELNSQVFTPTRCSALSFYRWWCRGTEQVSDFTKIIGDKARLEASPWFWPLGCSMCIKWIAESLPFWQFCSFPLSNWAEPLWL